MPKSIFLKHFQENLRLSIEELVTGEWRYKNLEIRLEDQSMKGQFNGFMDISIINNGNSDSIIAIEIEHIAEYDQAKRNITKLKTWTHNSSYRKCGFLHVLNNTCNISEPKLEELVKYARDNEKKGLGFFYDFIFYKVGDQRQTRETASQLVKSRDFRARLWMLMEYSGIIVP